MSGLQTIIDNCDSISIDRRKVVGVEITRNEIPRTSVTPTLQPWRMALTMPARFLYNEARDLLEALDRLDRSEPEVITFSNNDCLSWIFRYQGQASPQQLSGITVQSFVGNQLVLQNLPAIPATRVLFEPNDLIQIGDNTFPFTSQTRVTRGTDATVTVTTHRPNILSSSVDGLSLTVGNQCQFYMFSPNMPTYKLVPGGLQYDRFGRKVNNARIEFSDQFALHEWVAEA